MDHYFIDKNGNCLFCCISDFCNVKLLDVLCLVLGFRKTVYEDAKDALRSNSLNFKKPELSDFSVGLCVKLR